MMYVGFIFIAIFIGYSVGTAPIVGYNFGAKNAHELKSLLRKSAVISFTLGIAMTLIAFIFARPLSMIFVGYDTALLEMTVRGFRIFSLSFVLSGFCIYGSSFFTALNNGIISAAMSFMRTLVYQAVGILVLPIFWELDGIWYSMLVAEALALITTFIFLFANKKKYNY
jgi:Na+-driven multidrug efflux pump